MHQGWRTCTGAACACGAPPRCERSPATIEALRRRRLLRDLGVEFERDSLRLLRRLWRPECLRPRLGERKSLRMVRHAYRELGERQSIEHLQPIDGAATILTVQAVFSSFPLRQLSRSRDFSYHQPQSPATARILLSALLKHCGQCRGEIPLTIES